MNSASPSLSDARIWFAAVTHRFSGDTWLAMGLVCLLLLVTVVAGVQQLQPEEAPTLSSLSAAPDGARALHRWLESLDYEVSNTTGRTFQPPDDADVALILDPAIAFTDPELQTLDRWVEDGGTLLLAGRRPVTEQVLAHFDFRMRLNVDLERELRVQTPLLKSPPLPPVIANESLQTLESARDDFVTHLARGDQPVVVSFPSGAGQVILSSTVYPFTNAGLKETGNPELVLNLVTAGAPRQIWFDEWHHGLREGAPELAGPSAWLQRTPAGRSLLVAAVVIFIGLLLRGRSFGRPLPMRAATGRRSPLAYVTAVANLHRRAGHREAVLEQFHRQLKRRLGHRYRLSPDLPDEQFVQELAAYNPHLDVEELRRLLTRLRRGATNERELVTLAAEAADWLDRQKH